MPVRRPGTTEAYTSRPAVNSGPKRGRTRVHTVNVDVSSPFCELDALDSTTLMFESRGGSAVGVAAESRALNLDACSSMDGADVDGRSAKGLLNLLGAAADLGLLDTSG
mmetsp:Transcript_8322/g.18655  ORF Transcript_8322/g.18655 Transcript_8322/m.18655 type:complete len:109 (-) Transcript_8322:254-580(-)